MKRWLLNNHLFQWTIKKMKFKKHSLFIDQNFFKRFCANIPAQKDICFKINKTNKKDKNNQRNQKEKKSKETVCPIISIGRSSSSILLLNASKLSSSTSWFNFSMIQKETRNKKEEETKEGEKEQETTRKSKKEKERRGEKEGEKRKRRGKEGKRERKKQERNKITKQKKKKKMSPFLLVSPVRWTSNSDKEQRIFERERRQHPPISSKIEVEQHQKHPWRRKLWLWIVIWVKDLEFILLGMTHNFLRLSRFPHSKTHPPQNLKIDVLLIVDDWLGKPRWRMLDVGCMEEIPLSLPILLPWLFRFLFLSHLFVVLDWTINWGVCSKVLLWVLILHSLIDKDLDGEKWKWNQMSYIILSSFRFLFPFTFFRFLLFHRS